jgi:hypothetical protein
MIVCCARRLLFYEDVDSLFLTLLLLLLVLVFVKLLTPSCCRWLFLRTGEHLQTPVPPFTPTEFIAVKVSL